MPSKKKGQIDYENVFPETDEWFKKYSRAEEEKLVRELHSANKDVKRTAKNLSIWGKLAEIEHHVTTQLGMHKKDIQVIRTESDLESFITRAINNGILAYDTETNNSLDYLTCKVIGLCLYTPGLKAAYVPLHHVNPETEEELPNQLSNEFCAAQLMRALAAGVKFIMHNGKFDYQVTKCFLHVALTVYWDTMVGSRMIDENDESASLKWQYKDKIDKTHPDYDIDSMFPDIQYIYVSPEIFAYYAAVDALMTYELYVWQKEQLEVPEEANVLKLFTTVEMPLVIPVAEMELRGVMFDSEYGARLQAKYESIIKDLDNKIQEELDHIKSKILAWRTTEDANATTSKRNKKGELVKSKSKSEQLEDPINLGSSTQLAIIIYDIYGAKPVNPQKPRSTDKKTLPIIAQRENIPLCNLIVERRKVDTLLTDFIAKLPTLVRVDGAIHGSFNQCGKEDDGVVTGRFSSSDPNMQNIPSHNTEIRPVFKARPGYMLVGADFKAQEPRLTAYYSQDENMLEAYRTNKDLYAVIASAAFDNNYEDNLEFYAEGTEIEIEGQKIICGYKTHKNEEGYARRSQAKSILLGILYGRGAKSVGEQIGKSYDEAQKIINKFFASFPKVKEWIDSTHAKARRLGYVEDWYGRRRHLPEINLPKYSAHYQNGVENGTRMFNPLLNCPGRLAEKTRVEEVVEKCLACKKREDVDTIIKNALYEHIVVTDNTGIIAKAERQSVNSIVQGGAATLTKMAMRDLYYDEELQKLDFHMLITVHDEILGECPKENVDAVVKRVDKIMSTASAPYLNVPMGIDAEIGEKWYINNYISSIIAEYKGLVEGNKKKNIRPIPADVAFEIMKERHTEILDSELHKMVYNS